MSDPRLRHAAAHVLVPPSALDDDLAVALDPADAHHLVRVLRLRADEEVTATDGAGRWRPCRLLADAPSGGRRRDVTAALAPTGPVEVVPAAEPGVTIGFAPVKGDRPEWVVQKLTELGVDHIVVLEAERSVVRWEGDRGERSLERLRAVAREALGQCRRVHLPTITGPLTPAVLLASLTERGVRGALAEPGGDGSPSLDSPAILIGPEGGWAPNELRAVRTVDLGPATLRAETATFQAASLLCALRHGTVGPHS